MTAQPCRTWASPATCVPHQRAPWGQQQATCPGWGARLLRGVAGGRWGWECLCALSPGTGKQCGAGSDVALHSGRVVWGQTHVSWGVPGVGEQGAGGARRKGTLTWISQVFFQTPDLSHDLFPCLDPAECSECGFGVLAAGAASQGPPGPVLCPSSLQLQLQLPASPQESAASPPAASWLQVPKPPTSSSFLLPPSSSSGQWVPGSLLPADQVPPAAFAGCSRDAASPGRASSLWHHS